ncbi:MAG: hypothetical protein WC455_12590 [Dehalococcoidia bacterium]|jgi:hypothetical protein
MKSILALVALVALVSLSTAMPDSAWVSDPSICKIAIDTGSSMVGIFAWQNPIDDQWEVVLGSATYKGTTAVPIIFYGDKEGVVKVDMS